MSMENNDIDIKEDEDIEYIELKDIKDNESSTHKSGASPKKRTASDYIRYAIILIALGVFIFAGFNLIKIWLNYAKGDKEYKKVKEEVFVAEEIPPVIVDDQVVLEDVVEKSDDYKFKPYNHEALKAISPNAVGYLDIPAIDLNVPIAQCGDNDYYIDHAITGAYHSYGCPFIDYRIEEGINARNPIIYGHSMKNGAMFGMLTKYLTPSFYNAKGNKYIYLYCEEGIYIYEIFSVYITNAYDDSVYVFSYPTDNSYENYLINVKGKSYFNTGVSVSPTDKIITLSTCYDEKEARLIVQAKRL